MSAPQRRCPWPSDDRHTYCVVGAILIVVLISVSDQARAADADIDRVMVVRNEESPVSRAVAEDYVRRRGVANVLTVRCQNAAAGPENETISYAAYRQAIEQPLRAFLSSHPHIEFIVLTKGIPIRIADAPGRGLGGGRPSLDSYLAALDYEKTQGAISVEISDSGFTGTAWANRFWNSLEPFSHAKFGGYLVTRLDGYTEADAKAQSRPSPWRPNISQRTPRRTVECYWTPAPPSATQTARASRTHLRHAAGFGPETSYRRTGLQRVQR